MASHIDVNEAAVRRFISLLHERAGAAAAGMALQHPTLNLCTLAPEDTGKMRTLHYAIGDHGRMADDAILYARSGKNVYCEGRLVRGDGAKRGTIASTLAVVALVIERDGDVGKAGRALNGATHPLIVQTSPGNSHDWHFLDRALTPEVAKPLGIALRKAVGADHGTGDIAHCYRVAGTPNYPCPKKIARGRVTVLTSILDEGGVITRAELEAALPPLEPPPKPKRAKAPRKAKPSLRVASKARRKATARMDRSAEFQALVSAAVRDGMTPRQLERELRANPQGCASKYLEPTDRLRAEIARSWAKAEERQAENEELAIVPDPDADGAALLDAVHAFLGRFIIYPSPEAHAAHALWCAHAHLMDCWDSTPRLAFLSPERESGKTRALEITQLLVPRPVMAFDVTASFLFRKVADEAGPPTILYDEIDCVFKEHAGNHDDVRALINAGHRKGAVAGRCVVRGHDVTPEEWPAYAAVALAGIRYLPDTILSRSIVIRMRRRMPREAIEPFRARLHEAEGHALRDRLASWAAGITGRITGQWPVMPVGVADRAADTWEALIAIADAVGGPWPVTARQSAVAMVAALKEAQAESPNTRLLADMRVILADSISLSTATVLDKLWNLPESPWQDMRGKPLSDMGLARMLRDYGIKSTNVRTGLKVTKHYVKADFKEAWEAYLPPL